MPRTNPNPLRADWFAARALLASRRLRPLVPVGVLVVALVFAAALAARSLLADRAAMAQREAGRAQITQHDTLPLVTEVKAARSRLASRDSSLQALVFRVEAGAAARTLPPESQRLRDSLRTLLVQLDGALDRATKAPLAASYRVLASSGAMRTEGGVRDLLDTLDMVERARRMLGPVEAPQREFAQLTQRANAIGGTLQELAQARRATLARQILTLEKGTGTIARSGAVADDSIGVRLARDSARTRVIGAEALLREARQWHVMERARVDSTASARSASVLGASPMMAATAALLVAGVLIFTLAVAAEARRPTIAHAREAERMTGVPVLGTAHPWHLPREGRARLQLSAGIDPFRMVYLALTASGTRERTVCVSGADPEVVAAVVGRLAVSAATDERATLVVDVASGTPSATRYFGERHEPGFSEAIAAVRLWREVTRPVGASEGLGLDVVPAGARREDTAESVVMESNRREFHLFAEEYDFVVVAAPTRESLATALKLWKRPATIYAARIAQTPLDTMITEVGSLLSNGLDLHGILLVDTLE